MKRSVLLRIASWLVAAGLLLLLIAGVATCLLHREEVDTVPDVQKIARSLEIIRTSTPTNHKVLKVLFYGQSITRSGWEEAVVEHWHQRYPNTTFVVQNRALGGFPAQMLDRTTEQDITAFYPDLLIFHVYGDHRAYEQIIRLFRSLTAADVIVQTDHGESLPDPPCTEGLRLSLPQQPGCTGLLWLKQRTWYDEMSYHKIPAFAKKYGLALEPQRTWWRDYLLANHVDPKSMLADEIHPNDKGKQLIAAFFNQYFDKLVDDWNGQMEQSVVSIPANAAEPIHAQEERVSFEGSRLELISSRPLPMWPIVAVDGISPKDIDGCYQVTRASSIGTVPDWPALRRITLRHDHVAEDWTATLKDISPDQRSFNFSVLASLSGNEGNGDSAHDFQSRSGRLSIEAQDWMLERAFEAKHTALHGPFEVHWSVINVCAGTPEVIDRGNGAMEYRYVLGTGLQNEKHALTIFGPPEQLADVVEFREYRPPLHE
jgi:hypothetical protein